MELLPYSNEVAAYAKAFDLQHLGLLTAMTPHFQSPLLTKDLALPELFPF